jgi:threonylcarbamoyladenosine tRNA methylthiotransferase MtaB
MLKTFSIQTLGCRVNQYESDQLATLLRARGLTEVASGGDLRVVNTCSVTVQAASKSRQTTRRAVKLPVLREVDSGSWIEDSADRPTSLSTIDHQLSTRTIVTGCWATSNRADAANLPGVDAVLTHHDDVAGELDRLLDIWMEEQTAKPLQHYFSGPHITSAAAKSVWDDGSMIEVGTPQLRTANDTHPAPGFVKQKVARNIVGTHALPLLDERQSHHQRAYLKIQDGCDAHCTYCIIPQLRPGLWSKPVEDCVEEARALVDAGHKEIVLTGIFLGAYGQPTALRRRQHEQTAKPLADLVQALCTDVSGLHRLRFSSLEPGDLTDDLINRLRDFPQIVPHFHLPLQSGSDAILHRMNRQYMRDDFLRMIDRVHDAFDRPAITTDIIVGFPGETDEEFARTLEVVDRVRFIHTHAFSFSPRPGTAAARWEDQFIRGPIVNDRIQILNERSREHSLEFRQQFLGETVEVLVERPDIDDEFHHGRSERYFDVHFPRLAASLAKRVEVGDAVNLRITRVTSDRTWGEPIE